MLNRPSNRDNSQQSFLWVNKTLVSESLSNCWTDAVFSSRLNRHAQDAARRSNRVIRSSATNLVGWRKNLSANLVKERVGKVYSKKMWKPPRGFRGRDELYPPSDREAITIPYSSFQQAYLSKIGLKYIRPPESLAMLETTLFIVCENTVKTYVLEQSGTYTADEEQEYIDSTVQMEKWRLSIHCGANNLLNHNISQAFASFEFASQLLKRCLSEKNQHLFSKIVTALAYAQSRNAHDVVQQFLKHIAALTATSFGPRHPISVWARNMLVMGISPALVEKLYLAEMNAASSAKVIPRYIFECQLFVFKCEVLRAGYHLHEAEQTYRDLVDRGPISVTGYAGWRFQYQYVSVTMAQLYLEHQGFVKAASVVSDAPADLEEYVSKGWAPTAPLSAPLSILMIVWRLYVLGQALAGQEDHESANVAFKLAISAGLKYLDRDHPKNIQAQKAYSEYLSSQNLKEEADEIERVVDLGLDTYKLTLPNDE